MLDVEVLSKHCQACATLNGMDTSSDEFLDWWAGHQASCEVNFCGSSSTMESIGALAIWKWSVSKKKLRCRKVISDGDSKTFKCLSNQLPYGASNLVSKHECVGHVQKRMGTAPVREKAKEKFVNEREERVRMKGMGRLTDKMIKLLTRYYGKAIRCSMLSGRCFSTPSPQTAVHSTSIAPVASSSQHQYCPSGQQFTAPVLPQWPAVHSTSIAPVASGLGASSGGHLQISSHLHPTHPPSIQTLFLLSKGSLSNSLTLH